MFNKKKLLRLKLYIRYLLSKKLDSYEHLNNGKINIVVALAADYGNLGDVAITYAQQQYLTEKFPDANIVDFPISETFSGMKSLKAFIKPTDLITIVGGGNMGDLYDDIEYCRQFVISKFPNNKVICFPQTADFSEGKQGTKSLKKAISVYSSHKDLILIAREEKTFELYNKHFNNKTYLSPDIVLHLDIEDEKLTRDGVTFILRKDKEKIISSIDSDTLISVFENHYKVNYSDTHIDKSRMSTKQRKLELSKIWNVFLTSELIVTDRLHGMIFSKITNTPCIAIDNSNKKVSGVLNLWLKNCENIKLITDFEYQEVYNLSLTLINSTSKKVPIDFEELDRMF